MTSETPGLVARLKRLPAQLLLALVDATALLVITACILLVVVLNRVDHAAETIAGKVTDATISRLDMSPADVRERLQSIDQKISALSAELDKAGTADGGALAREIADLNRNLTEMKSMAQALGNAGPEVTEAAFSQVGELLTNSLYAIRGCTLRGEQGS